MADESTLGAEEQAFAQLLSSELQPQQEQPQATDDNNYYGLGLKKDQALAVFKAIDPELDDFPKLREAIQQNKEYRTKIQEYERSPVSYANELVQELDSMYKEGATDDDVDNFLRVQRMDISKMQDLDAVKIQMKMEHPTMTDEMVEGMLQEEFGSLDYEEMTPYQKGKLTIKAKTAKEAIAKYKKEVKTSTVGVSRKQQQEAINAKAAQWLKVINVFLANIKEFPIPLALKDKKPFAQIKIALLPEFKQQLAFQIAQFALNSNLAMDKTAPPLIQDFIKRSMYFAFGDYIVEETIKHASDEKLRNFHNINNPHTPPADTPLTKTEQEKIAKQINDFTLGTKP